VRSCSRSAAERIFVSLTIMTSARSILRLEWLVAPRYARWCRIGAVVGATLGALAYFGHIWYFEFGPCAASIDRVEAQGYVALLLGVPFSILFAESITLGPFTSHFCLMLSAAASWSIVGAIIAGVAAVVFFRVHST
jgi:hypothetical protein